MPLRPLAFAAALLLASAPVGAAAPGAAHVDPRIAERVVQLTRRTRWTPVAAVRIGFQTFHPQGMVKIGDDVYVSSVEIRTLPKRLAAPVDGHDYDAGSGVGHLFKIGPHGELLADLVLGDGAIYHPGGVDFDGRSIWVPVSEYRPHSRAIVYRVDPATMKATEVLRAADHIGAVAYDPGRGELHGVNWGSRDFYTWTLGTSGGPGPARPTPVSNPDHYIDYQDCHYVGARRMLCAGVAEYRTGPDAALFQLGGLDLVDLGEHRPVWEVPIPLWSPSGRAMTQNPFFVEATPTGLRAYFMPDDDASTLYVFDAAVP